MSKKLTGRALARFEAGRDVWQEVLDGARAIKAGKGKRVKVQPTRSSSSRQHGVHEPSSRRAEADTKLSARWLAPIGFFKSSE
jgi:hypothetical protein